MRVQIKNLGVLKQAEFSLGNLTILCGNNNTGKTYATYALFGFLSFWKDAYFIRVKEKEIDMLFTEGVVHINLLEYIKQIDDILTDACSQYTKQLPMVFASPVDRFQETSFQVSLDANNIRLLDKYEQRIASASAERFSITKENDSTELIVTLLVEKEKIKIPSDVIMQIVGNALKDVIFGNYLPNVFIASAERTGAAIFRKELNFTRNRLLEEMSKTEKSINRMELLFKVYTDYPLPVKKNVEFIRELESTAKNNSFVADRHPDMLDDFADIIGGSYTVTRNDELYYAPKGKSVKLSMDESSSAVRSLLDIGFYLRHVAQPGDLFMIDEPELNLHPEKLANTMFSIKDDIKLKLDEFNRPLEYFAYTVHNGCTRNEYFEYKISNHKFGAKEGCMFYEHGCQAPYTKGSCNKILWNEVNSKTRAGQPCMGCTEPTFPKNDLYNTKKNMGIPANLPLGVSKRAYLTLAGVTKAFKIPRLEEDLF